MNQFGPPLQPSAKGAFAPRFLRGLKANLRRVLAVVVWALLLMASAYRSAGVGVNFQLQYSQSMGSPFFATKWGFAQGVAMNGSNIYHFSTQSLSRQSVTNLTAFSTGVTNAAPFSGLTNAYNHLGAGCFYAGSLYVSAEVYDGCGKTTNASIEMFDGQTLAFKSITVVSNYQAEISAVTVSPGGTVYTTDFCDGSRIYTYDTNLNYLGSIALSTNIPLIQGIACYANLLIVIADYGGSGRLWAIDPASGRCSLLAMLSVPGNNEWEGIDIYNGTLLACEAGSGGLYYYPMNIAWLRSQLDFTQIPYSSPQYQIQYKTNVMGTNWINLGVPMSASGNVLSITDFSTDQQRYYRALLLP
jgi:hypothetical protein